MKQNKNRIESLFYNASQVSKFLCIPLRTIYRLSKQGKLKAVKIGKHWRYVKTEIEKYLSTETDFSAIASRRNEEFAERRTYPRINCYFKCLYKIYLSPEKDINSQGILRNISASGGLLIKIEEHVLTEIDIGDPIKLDFEMSNNGDPRININTRARVVRKTTEGFAVKFRNMDEKYKKALIEFVG